MPGPPNPEGRAQNCMGFLKVHVGAPGGQVTLTKSLFPFPENCGAGQGPSGFKRISGPRPRLPKWPSPSGSSCETCLKGVCPQKDSVRTHKALRAFCQNIIGSGLFSWGLLLKAVGTPREQMRGMGTVSLSDLR